MTWSAYTAFRRSTSFCRARAMRSTSSLCSLASVCAFFRSMVRNLSYTCTHVRTCMCVYVRVFACVRRVCTGVRVRGRLRVRVLSSLNTCVYTHAHPPLQQLLMHGVQASSAMLPPAHAHASYSLYTIYDKTITVSSSSFKHACIVRVLGYTNLVVLANVRVSMHGGELYPSFSAFLAASASCARVPAAELINPSLRNYAHQHKFPYACVYAHAHAHEHTHALVHLEHADALTLLLRR